MMDPYVSPGEYSFRAVPCVADSRRHQRAETAIMPSSTSNLWMPHQHRNPHGKQLENLMLLLGNSPEPRAPRPSGKNRRHHCPSQNVYAIFIHPKQLSPFPERLELPFPDEEILSSCDEDVSFIRDRFTAWVKADPNDTLERHVVDVRKAFAEFREFREASVRRCTKRRVYKESGTSTWKRGCY